LPSRAKAAVAYYASLGAAVARVMIDNGSCYRSHASERPARRTRPEAHPNQALHATTNGKAERFIQSALRECAYAQAYPSPDRRAAEPPVWLHRYNRHRPHGGIKSQTPISRLGLNRDNLMKLHT